MKSLQELFLESRGMPVSLEGVRVIQMDEIEIPPRSLVEVRFIGDKHHKNNAAVLAVRKKSKIFLSDGSWSEVVAIWDDPPLPRSVSHLVESPDGILQVYNKYRIFHSDEWCTEDNFTGNAGLIVEDNSPNSRAYRCSNGLGPFSPNDLVFELRWRPRP